MSEELLQALAAVPIIGIVRTRRGRHSIGAVQTVLAAGITTVEVTTSSDDWAEVIAAVGRAHPGALLGAGTILSVEQVRRTAEAGGRFVVAPNTDPEVGRAALDLGLGWFPGAMTPTEIVAAHRAGATAVKVFPASTLGGPDYLRQVLAPLPEIPLVPTGGVAIDRIADYLAAGAAAVGLGSPLFGDSADTGDFAPLAAKAAAALAGAGR